MRTFDLLIFDLDGTLIDSLGDIAWSLNTTLEEYGLLPFSLDMVKTFIGNGSRVLIENALAKSSRSDLNNESSLDRIHQHYLVTYKQNLLRTTVCFEGVISLLERSRAAGFVNVVLTNKPEELSVAAARGLGLLPLVEDVIGPERYGVRKPDPRAVHTLCAQYGISRPRTLLIGDSGVDLETARNAGVQAACVSYGFGTAHELSGADFLLDRFEQLLGVIGLC